MGSAHSIREDGNQKIHERENKDNAGGRDTERWLRYKMG
jgi:hypothetical protein